MKSCNKLPGIGCEKFENILETCRKQLLHSQHCSACDEGDFFRSLHKEMSEVVDFFNRRTQKLLERHLSSGCKKCFVWLENKLQGNHVSMIQECNDLVTYATVNSTCIRSILKKYDKIHYSRQGQDFKTRAQIMHIEILQSPWFYELMAFQINLLRESKVDSGNNASSAVLKGCSLVFNDEKPFLSIELDLVKLDIELTCSICLETTFDPVSLACGHIFCYICACKASSVGIVDGLSTANPNQKCPICRQEGVYEYYVHLDEVNLLLKRSCPEYWEARRKSESKERLELIKKHWRDLPVAIYSVRNVRLKNYLFKRLTFLHPTWAPQHPPASRPDNFLRFGPHLAQKARPTQATFRSIFSNHSREVDYVVYPQHATHKQAGQDHRTLPVAKRAGRPSSGA
ncbi:hypothetical protein CASFOL_009950 [Castilleja foliolosa]|uniref:RING-type E3 ubiquitin transferase n=1 Tax=Castilleja foliolosa TaxID=1961234 RepID=A0ABD3DV73_9LAMI